ncbi:MAG: PDZ domain-containing protein [Actinobacteria bacterium]|nr:PDZ domain-containing protein [Actinomycetota bacterium]MSX88586.1 PDZ domain-containing protein [Actinomycetota bacterium]MSY72821.1 PDZ domain-containing protein [Actinomycetota bacterium]
MLPPPPDPLWSSPASTPSDPTIEPPPPPVGPAGSGRRWPRTMGMVGFTLIFTVLVLAAVATQISVPWVAIEPGSASPAEDRVSVTGAPTFAPDGDILFLTVRVNRLSLLELLTKSRDTAIDLVSERDYFGTSTPQQSRQQSKDLMVRAKSNAELVALSALGYQAFVNSGVRIESIEGGSAADGSLEQLEVITSVDGTATNTPQELITNLAGRAVGVSVTISVQRADESEKHDVTVTLGARPDGKTGGFLGITTSQRVSEAKNLPVMIDIDSGNVGGNSAGLAFTLAIIDELTDGSLTGNNRVAVTGSIELDGSVGEVGGISQKVVAARRAGAKYFLVPRSLEAEAKKNPGELIIIPISNLKEALDALASIGGNANSLALTLPAAKK